MYEPDKKKVPVNFPLGLVAVVNKHLIHFHLLFLFTFAVKR